MKLLENLNWRYATKKFDTTKKISDENIEKLKKAMQLSASSYGLQPYKILIIKNKDLKEKLRPVSWGQAQITDSSHLIVFCSKLQMKKSDVLEFMQLKSEAYNKDIKEFEESIDFVAGKLGEKSEDEQKCWTSKQTYIVIGILLAACSELRIDSCPMEGFEPDKYDEILGLTEQGLTASVIATIGYRSKEDKAQFAPKVRKSESELFEYIK